MKIRRMLPLLAAVCLLLTGCGDAPAENSASFFAMDTYVTVRAYGADEELLRSAEDRVEKLESLLSVTREDSEISRLNRDGCAELSKSTADLLRRALELGDLTAGALDVTVYPIVRAWGFTTGKYRVPTEAEISELLSCVDYRNVTLTDAGAAVPAGTMVDLGSVAKGYAGEQIAALLRDGGVRSALLDLGGNVQTVGAKPDGTPWSIAVRDPHGDGYLGVVSVTDEAVVTSGGYERYFVDESGAVRWHIMDPATGSPAQSGLLSATVVGKSGVICDGLSTALFVLGKDRAEALWRQMGSFEMILLSEEGELWITPGLEGRFTSKRYRPEVMGRD